MPGTLLLKDYEAANADELQQHLASLMAQAPTPSDSLTNPVIQPTPAPPTVLVDNSQDATQTRDELQAHLDSLTAPAAPPRPLQLLGEGLTSLGAGAQNVKDELSNHLLSLIAPQSAPPTTAPTPSDSLTNPLETSAATTTFAPDQTASDRVRGQAEVIAGASARTGVPAPVIAAIMDTEAGGPNSRSSQGANGFMQVLDSHFRPGENPFDPTTNITRGAEILADNYKRYGSWDKAAAAYFGSIDAQGNITNASDAQGTSGGTYVSRFLSNLQHYGGAAAGGVQQAAPGGGKPGWLQVAESQLGKPYIWGSGSGAGGRGTGDIDPATGQPIGFDCSGFVSYVYKNALGIDLPAQTASAYAATKPVGLDQAQPGDVVLYNMDNPDPHVQHIAIYLGDGKVIQAGGSAQTRNVNVAPISTAGTFEIRRAAGAETALNNQKAAVRVADDLHPDTPAPPGATYTAANVSEPEPLQLIGEGFSSLGSRAQDIAQGGLKIIHNATQQVADTSGPQTAAMQPTPSDVLTNPLGTGNAAQPTAALTAQPAGGISESQPLNPVARGVSEAVSGIQSPQTGNPLIDVIGTGASALGTGAQNAATGLRNMTPTSELARGALGQEQLVTENRALFDQQQRLVDEFTGAQARADQAAMDRIRQEMDALQAQLPDARNRDVLQAAAERNPALPLVETGANLAGAAAAAPLVAEGAPLAARALATAIDPLTGLPSLAGRALESPEVQAALRTRQRAEGINPFNPPSLLPSRPPAPGPAAGDAAEVARLRLDKFPDWLQPTIEDAARATDFAAEQRRGVIPNAQAEAMADQVGRSVDDWIKQSKIGTTLNTEETRALRNVITSQAQKVQDLAEQVSTAAGRGEATDQLIAQAAIEGNKLQDLTTMMEGARAEWGRAGSAWKAETRLIDLPPNEAISEIYKTLGGRDNALAAVQELNALQQAGASPIQLAQFWAKLKNPEAGFQDWVKALRYNSMLSGPRTIEVNGIGNALEIPWRMARDTGASLLRGRPEELAPEAAGLVAGFDKGRRAFMETLTHGMTTEQALAGEIPHSLADRVRNPVLQPVAKVLDVPSRILGAGDAWGKAMAQSMALGRRAGVTASKEGLSGPAWNERVAELLSNPSKDMLKEADAISERMVYHGEMGSLGTALEQIQRVPFLGNVILPFLRTVYHIQARGIDRSPVGAIGTAIDIGRGKYGPRSLGNLREQLGASVGPSKGVAPLGERLGDNIMGTAATVAFFQKAQDGAITGAGPDDPEKRDMLRAQGWQPYSLKLGDHYVSYANWGPVATPLAMAAGAAEAIQYRKQNAANVPAILVDAGRRTAKLVTEQSYLQGIGAIWKALEQPDRYSAQTLGQMMTSLVPYGSALNTLGQARDPLQRQVGKVADVGLPTYLQQSVEARLPGLREQLPAAQDQLGRPIPNEAEGAGALNPLRSTTIRSNAVLQELLANGADVGEPPTSVRNVDLTPAEQRTVNEKAGQYIERNVQAVMADADYKKADDLGKQRALQRAIERARMQAGGELLQSLSEVEIKRRLEESRTKREPVPIGLGG